MGHYDNCRPGYCATCGAAPGNLVNGVCPFCKPSSIKGLFEMAKVKRKTGGKVEKPLVSARTTDAKVPSKKQKNKKKK